MAYSDLLSPEVMEPVIWSALVSIEGQAVENANGSVVTGNLQNSITIKTNKQSKQHGNSPDGLKSSVGELEGVIGSAAVYAQAVEYGRDDMPNYPAQPYLRPALDWFRNKIGQISGAELKKQLTIYANRHPYKVKEYTV
jgi:hypothetical protein